VPWSDRLDTRAAGVPLYSIGVAQRRSVQTYPHSGYVVAALGRLRSLKAPQHA